MDTFDRTFIWTPERTETMFKLRFENDWLFKRKKQPWKEFRDILLKNGFPEEMTLDQIRKKWSYTYDCFRLAKRTKNKKWIYYKLFDKHFRKNKVLDKYESWNNEWRCTLIKCIMLVIDAETGNIEWRLVENHLRLQNLPIDCCIQDMRALWHHLKVTFHRKYRLNLKKGDELSQWPQYTDILNYYETHEPDYLTELAKESVAIIKNKKGTRKRIKMEDSGNDNNENEDFHWTKDITESFIQIRLQHEWLFRERKWAWNDLATIMYKDFGFPTYLTGRMMCHKWGSTYSDYQKAKATGNNNWLYYNLFEAYLNEDTANFDPYNNWKEEWINRLIVTRTELEELFTSGMKPPHPAWREVEKRLRSEGLPLDHSLLDLSEMWIKLFKTFKWKRKFERKGLLNVKWPYFENMMRYTVARQVHCKKEAENAIPDTSFNDDFDDDIVLYDLKKKIDNDVKDEIVDNLCRACCKEEGSVNLFDDVDENGLDLAAKLKVIAGVEIEKVDRYPNEICSKCLKELESAYNFRKKCQVTDSKLRNMKINNVKIEINVNEDSSELQIDESVDNFNDGVFDDNIEDLFKDTKEIIKKVKTNKTRKKYSYDYSRVCEVCGKSTRNIKNHMDSHATDKMYDCDQCGKKFKFKSGLVIHRAVHNPVPKKTCDVCGKAFHILAQYRKHYVYHINERKFSCESCGKSFHTKEILTVHMRTHTDERPFSCPDCGKTFRTAGCVSRHRRIVHKKISKG